MLKIFPIIIIAVSICFSQIDLDAGPGAGRITYYDQSPAAACDIPQSEWPEYTAALDEPHFLGGLACGATARLVNGDKEVQVMVVDLCPTIGNEQWCSGDLVHFDLGGAGAFALLEPVSTGVRELQYQWVPSPVGDTPVKLRFKDGINPWWVAIEVLNHRYPVVLLEIQDPASGEWRQGDRTLEGMWNYWQFSFTGNGLQPPFNIRITDQYGQVIEEAGTVVQESFMWEGVHQFPLLERHGGSAVKGASADVRADSRGIYIAGNRLCFTMTHPNRIDIFDVSGNVFLSRMPQPDQQYIDLAGLPRGLYIANAGTGERQMVLKFYLPGLSSRAP